MNNVDLGYTSHCCRSSETDRLRGAGLREWLKGLLLPGDSAAEFLRLSLAMPFSKNSYLALRRLNRKDFEQTYLVLKIGKSRRVCWVYNLWKDCPEAVAAFLNLPATLECRANTVLPEFSERQTFTELLSWIEASHVGHFSPILISVMGGRFDAAQPHRILLDVPEVLPAPPGTKKKRSFSKTNVAQYVRRLQQARLIPETSGGAQKIILDGLRREMREAVHGAKKFEAAAILAVDSRYGTNLPLQTAERESRAIVAAFSILDRQVAGVTVGSPEMIAFSLIAKALKELDRKPEVVDAASPGDLALCMMEDLISLGEEDEEDWDAKEDNGFPNLRRRRRPELPRPLYHPQTVLNHYGLGSMPPTEIHSIKESLCRVAWCILGHSGRRAHCLSKIVMGDFVSALDPQTGRRVADLIMRGTKSGEQSLMRLPLSLMWPEVELDHLHLLLGRLRLEHPNEWASLGLMVQICGEIVKKGDIDERSSHLRNMLPRSRSWLHLPRSNFASWLVIRIMCARNRQLLDPSWFPKLRTCPWFSEDMLDRLLILVGNDATDALEVARRLLGHASTFEFISSYCASWAIQGEMLQAR